MDVSVAENENEGKSTAGGLIEPKEELIDEGRVSMEVDTSSQAAEDVVVADKIEDTISMDYKADCNEEDLSHKEEKSVVVTRSVLIDVQVQPTDPICVIGETETTNLDFEKVEHLESYNVESVCVESEGGDMKSRAASETEEMSAYVACNSSETKYLDEEGGLGKAQSEESDVSDQVQPLTTGEREAVKKMDFDKVETLESENVQIVVDKLDLGDLKSGNAPKTEKVPNNVTCNSSKTKYLDGVEELEKAQIDVTDVHNQVDLVTENAPPADSSINLADKANKRTTIRERASDLESQDQARYYLSLQEKDGFSPSDLVWGKVKSHPWWPGQVFDSSYASEMALKHQRKEGGFLVAYFGDKTFAWCEDSQLKQFQKHFSQFVNQSTSDAFLNAIDEVLHEVSRRVQLGVTCTCLPEEAYADIKYQKVENAGIKEGFCGSVIDSPRAVDSFQPSYLLEYVHRLAQFPCGGADRLDLVIAKAQLRAFYRTKGFSELPTFLAGGSLDDTKQMTADGVNESERSTIDHSATKTRKSRGRKRKNVDEESMPEDDKKQKSLAEMMEEEDAIVDEVSQEHTDLSGKKHRLDLADIGIGKEKNTVSLGDQEPKSPSVISNGSFKVGEWIRRAANNLTVSRPVVKLASENLRKCTTQGDDIMNDHFSDDALLDTDTPGQDSSDGSKRGRKRKPTVKVEAQSESPGTSPCSSPKKGKRGRKRKVDPCLANSYFGECNLVSVPVSSDVTPDHMKDSYWSDIVFHDNPEKEHPSNGLNRMTRRRMQKIKQEEEPAQMLCSVSALESPTSMQVGAKHDRFGERPKIILEERIVEEKTPTALVLNFSKADAIPSEAELMRIFSRYGPLKELGTAVHRKTKRAKVVFKKRADAEVAFSSAGKYSIFGRALLSYRLKDLPLRPEDFPSTQQQDQGDAVPAENVVVEAPDPSHAENGETILDDLEAGVPSTADVDFDVKELRDHAQYGDETLLVEELANMEAAELVMSGSAQTETENQARTVEGQVLFQSETAVYEELDSAQSVPEALALGELDSGVLVESNSELHQEMQDNLLADPGEVDHTKTLVAEIETKTLVNADIEESTPFVENPESAVSDVPEPGQSNEEAPMLVEPAQGDSIVLGMPDSGVVQVALMETVVAAETETEKPAVAGLEEGTLVVERPDEETGLVFGEPGQPNEERPKHMEPVQAAESNVTVVGDSELLQEIPGQSKEKAPKLAVPVQVAETEAAEIGDSDAAEAPLGAIPEKEESEIAVVADLDQVEDGSNLASEPVPEPEVEDQGQPDGEAVELAEPPQVEIREIGGSGEMEAGSRMEGEPENRVATAVCPVDGEAGLEAIDNGAAAICSGAEHEVAVTTDLGQMGAASNMDGEPGLSGTCPAVAENEVAVTTDLGQMEAGSSMEGEAAVVENEAAVTTDLGQMEAGSSMEGEPGSNGAYPADAENEVAVTTILGQMEAGSSMEGEPGLNGACQAVAEDKVAVTFDLGQMEAGSSMEGEPGSNGARPAVAENEVAVTTDLGQNAAGSSVEVEPCSNGSCPAVAENKLAVKTDLGQMEAGSSVEVEPGSNSVCPVESEATEQAITSTTSIETVEIKDGGSGPEAGVSEDPGKLCSSLLEVHVVSRPSYSPTI